MTQHATNKIRNLKASIEKFAKDKLISIEGLSIDWEGFPFESGATSITKWIQLRILDVADPNWHPRASSSTRGNMATVLVSFNCFANREAISSANRHYVLRDTVAKYFYSGSSVPLRNYAGGTTQPWTCLMPCRQVETDRVIPNENLLQYNYTVRLEYLRQFED